MERKGPERKGKNREGIGRRRKERRRKNGERKGKDGKEEKRKGKERKVKENWGKTGKERKGKERKERERNVKKSTGNESDWTAVNEKLNETFVSSYLTGVKCLWRLQRLLGAAAARRQTVKSCSMMITERLSQLEDTHSWNFTTTISYKDCPHPLHSASARFRTARLGSTRCQPRPSSRAAWAGVWLD